LQDLLVSENAVSKCSVQESKKQAWTLAWFHGLCCAVPGLSYWSLAAAAVLGIRSLTGISATLCVLLTGLPMLVLWLILAPILRTLVLMALVRMAVSRNQALQDLARCELLLAAGRYFPEVAPEALRTINRSEPLSPGQAQAEILDFLDDRETQARHRASRPVGPCPQGPAP
jgi:hypothetical protein